MTFIRILSAIALCALTLINGAVAADDEATAEPKPPPCVRDGVAWTFSGIKDGGMHFAEQNMVAAYDRFMTAMDEESFGPIIWFGGRNYYGRGVSTHSEFLITIDRREIREGEATGTWMWEAKLTRPEATIVRQLQGMVPQEALWQRECDEGLVPESPEWVAAVAELAPSQEEAFARLNVVSRKTDSRACPALAEAVRGLTQLPLVPDGSSLGDPDGSVVMIRGDGTDYDLSFTVDPRNMYRVRATLTHVADDSVWGKWVEATRDALEPCWTEDVQEPK